MIVLQYPTQQVDAPRTVATVGNFDGLHQGHERLIALVRQRARRFDAAAAVLTFEPHTRTVLHGEAQPILTTFEEKATLIEQLGVDYLIKIPFTRQFAALSAEEFVAVTLREYCHAVEWVMGPNHTFGRHRRGGTNFLRKRDGINHFSIFTANLDINAHGAVISSTAVREALLRGDVEEAVSMLGHPYLVIAEHITGVREGTRLGFPTLNYRQLSSEKVVPPPGVYAAELQIGAQVVRGALYYGNCPTFENRDFHFEIHVFDTAPPAVKPGERGAIWIRKFIRRDRGFASPRALTEQIQKDIEAIQQFFAEE